MNSLIIDACISDSSRTRGLAAYLQSKLIGDVDVVRLYETKPYSLDEKMLKNRDMAAEKHDVSDNMFAIAKQFARADTVIVAAPYWDLSFPAALKQYIEAINVCGLTFRYTDTGMPVSLCNAKRLIYITTAGGYIVSDEFGFGYIKSVMELFYGVKTFDYIKAEGLDIVGADACGILRSAREEIDKIEL